MSRIKEADLVLPALFFISQRPGITTSDLILELRAVFNPVGEDAEILSGRNDDKFSQIVRNLVSHHTLDERYGFTTLDSSERNASRHTITQTGTEYLEDNKTVLSSLLSGDFDYEGKLDGATLVTEAREKGRKILPYDENLLISEGRKKEVTSQVYERSKTLRDKAVEVYTNDGKIICQVCDFDFFQTYGEIGDGFIEIHHQKPIFQYEGDDFSKFLDVALEDMVPVCSNCHRMIHRKRDNPLSIQELRDMVSSQLKKYKNNHAKQ